MFGWYETNSVPHWHACYRDGLLFTLAQRYREDPSHFLHLSKQSMGSALTREIVAELRNAGHIEEDVRILHEG